MYKIINNLLTYSEQDILESAILNENTQWIFNRFAAYKNKSYDVSDATKKIYNYVSSCNFSKWKNVG